MEQFDGVHWQLLILSASALGVSLFSKLIKLPTILGYAALGALIGPYGLKVLSDSEQIPQIAEIGMMALLFSIGLKFNLDMFRSLQRHVFVFGGLQFFLCTAVGVGFLRLLGIEWYDAVIYASAFSLSSTAVVSKLLLERGEFATSYGTRAISALLLQDLAVVMLLILIPAVGTFTEGGESQLLALEMLLILIEVVLLFVVLLFFGPFVLVRWMRFVSRTGSNEIFVINLLVVIFGFSWVTEHMGFSAALGAFVAGILLAETPQKYQVEEIIAPFREIFLGFFFIALGTLTDFRLVLDGLLLILAAVVAILVVKTAVIYLISWAESWRDSAHNLRVAVALGGTGEFSFVLLASSVTYLDPQWFNVFLLSTLIAMAFTPMVWSSLNAYIARHNLDRSKKAGADAQASRPEGKKVMHTVIFGFGRTGRKIAEVLRHEGVTYAGIEVSQEQAIKATEEREPIFRCSDLRLDPETISRTGLQKADAVLITFIDPDRVLATIAQVRAVNKDAHLITKSGSKDHVEGFKQAGANEVVVEAAEGGVLIAGLALGALGVPPLRVQHLTSQIGGVAGALASGFARRQIGWEQNPSEAPRVLAVTITEQAACIGKSIADAVPHDREVEVISLARDGETIPLGQVAAIQANDVLLLLGRPAELHDVERLLISGASRAPRASFSLGRKN